VESVAILFFREARRSLFWIQRGLCYWDSALPEGYGCAVVDESAKQDSSPFQAFLNAILRPSDSLALYREVCVFLHADFEKRIN